ncbi:MAG: response regulator, partial [Bacteroidales bacterium]|nr:response regulator [Bacteroidales bacterium]
MNSEHILIVDDEETLCEVLKLNLENEGYDVDIAFSAEQALMLDLKNYSLILLDIMMGEMSGIKFARLVKSKVETANIPIIFCTA